MAPIYILIHLSFQVSIGVLQKTIQERTDKNLEQNKWKSQLSCFSTWKLKSLPNAVDLWSNITAMDNHLHTPHCSSYGDEMCGDGSSMAKMLDHTSTAVMIGRRVAEADNYFQIVHHSHNDGFGLVVPSLGQVSSPKHCLLQTPPPISVLFTLS